MKEKLLELYKQKQKLEEEKEKYEKLKEEAVNEFIKKGKKHVTLNKTRFSLGVTRDINEEKLKENYPEIWYSGLITKFSKSEAKKDFPNTLVDTAIEECSEERGYYVRISENRKRKRTNKASPRSKERKGTS